jgi:SET domain
VLCHEHAGTHKLPELDLNTSIQMQVEDKIDQKLMRLHGVRQNRVKSSNNIKSFWNKFGRRGGPSSNPFFPGLRGDRLNAPETTVLKCMQQITGPQNVITGPVAATKSVDDVCCADRDDLSEASDNENGSTYNGVEDLPVAFSQIMDGNIPFCIPIDLRDEVFSKPPMYTHISANKVLMSTISKPKKVPGSQKGEQEKCTCVGRICGHDCYNRITMTECTGPHNCNIWDKTKDCGNRALSKRQYVKCKPQREPGKGWGLVALQSIEKGQLVHEYVGEIIDEKEKEKRLMEWNVDHPNDPNFYVMALGAKYYVDARVHGNQSRFINHSCNPNTRVATINVKGSLRNGIYATKIIKAGEFLCYDYHFDTKNGDMFICRCAAPNCRGTMKEGKNTTAGSGTGTDSNKDKRTLWKEAKERYDEDCKFLQETKSVISLVGPLVPGAEHEGETVAMGPQRRQTVSRVFLARNARLGADFVSRKSRLER